MNKKQKKNAVSENVLQGNEISRAQYLYSVKAQRIIEYAVYNMQKVSNISPKTFLENSIIDYRTFKARFSIKDMCKALGCEYDKKQAQEYVEAVNELMTATIKLQTKKKIEAINLVSYCQYNLEKHEIQIVFNPFVFERIFDEHYSKIPLKIFGQLKKTYSQKLFFVLLSYRNMMGKYGNNESQWKVEIPVAELRKIYDLADDEISRGNNFIKYCVKNPVDEINKYNYEFKISFSKSGKPVNKITFECSSAVNVKALPETKERYDVIDVNNEKKFIAQAKLKYAEEWKEIATQIKKQDFLQKLNKETQKTYLDMQIFNVLKERHNDI